MYTLYTLKFLWRDSAREYMCSCVRVYIIIWGQHKVNKSSKKTPSAAMHTIPNGNKRAWKLVGECDRDSGGKRSEWEMVRDESQRRAGKCDGHCGQRWAYRNKGSTVVVFISKYLLTLEKTFNGFEFKSSFSIHIHIYHFPFWAINKIAIEFSGGDGGGGFFEWFDGIASVIPYIRMCSRW